MSPIQLFSRTFRKGHHMLRSVARLESRLDALTKSIEGVRSDIRQMQRHDRAQLRQYHLLLARLTRILDRMGADREDEPPRLASRPIPLEAPEPVPIAWDRIEAAHPDPEGLEWRLLESCPVCGCRERTVVNPWNKLLLLPKAPDDESARYDYAICHACGILFASRRPTGARYLFLLEHFGEVTAKRGGIREIANPVLNPYPLTDEDRRELRRLAAKGVFVSDHSKAKNDGYLSGLARDRFESSGHVDIIGSLLQPRGARVLEVRAKTGALTDGLRRYWNADVYSMPIWESQQVVLQEVYGIPASSVIDFEHFSVPFEGTFDLIVCQHMVTHVLSPREFFAELRRKLNPGGHIYLYNEPDDSEFLAQNQSMIATLNPLHMQAFDQRSLLRALAANGFDVVYIKRHDRAHVCLARQSDSVRMIPIDAASLRKRIERYRIAYDRALLRMDERVRGRVADQWEAAVERAVAAGIAEFDENGRLRLVAS